MNMIDITPIVNAVIALLAAGVSVFLIPWIKSKTTDSTAATCRWNNQRRGRAGWPALYSARRRNTS